MVIPNTRAKRSRRNKTLACLGNLSSSQASTTGPASPPQISKIRAVARSIALR